MKEQLIKTAENALLMLKDRGAELAQSVVSFSETREFNVDGGEFSLLRTLFDKSIVLRAIKEGKRGSTSANRFDEASLKAACDACMEAASSAEADPAWDLAPAINNGSFEMGCEVDLDLFFERLKELMADIKVRYPKIIMEQLIASHEKSVTVYRNSKGAAFEKENGEYALSLMFSGHEGEKSSSFFGTGVTTTDLSRPLIELGSIAKDLADVEKQIETENIEGKFVGTLILTPAAAQDLVGTALSNFAGDTSLLEGTSIWKDKLGQSVASESLTIRIDPFDERIVGGQRFTGEGFPAEGYTMIEKGVLQSFMTSLYVANKTGLPRAKNSSSSMIIKAGDKSLDEIIGETEKGIIVARFSGGAPSVNGDFSGVAKNCFLVENGKIGPALSETMISGNLAEMLKNILAISSELVCDGMSVMPYMAFSGITISGK